MLAQDYIAYVNAELERLLVYETVFKEYIHTCQNIEKGNCYASESLSRLREYFSKNVLRFNRFVDQCALVTAPKGYVTFNRQLIAGLRGIQHGVSVMLMGIECDQVNHQLFDTGLKQQKDARAAIDHAFMALEQPQAI